MKMTQQDVSLALDAKARKAAYAARRYQQIKEHHNAVRVRLRKAQREEIRKNRKQDQGADLVGPVSRTEAIERGLKFYFTGRPCNKGNVAPRFVSSCSCTCPDCMQIMKAATARRRADAQAKEADAKKVEQYRASNPTMINSIMAKRRGKKLNASPAWDADLTDFVMREAACLAKQRGKLTGQKWDVDHLVPLQAKEACGLHTWSNLQVIPKALNLRKSNKMQLTSPGEWIAFC